MGEHAPRATARAWLEGGGETGELVRAFDWSKTALGSIDSWPASLKVTVGTVLHSRHPMFLWWGPELLQIYNDAYLPSFGKGKHPAAMGQRGAECWQEIWPIIFPQIDDAMSRAKASWNEDHLVPVWRNERIEEVYWTYGYSPVFDESGDVGGTLVVCTETTAKVLGERRRRVVRSLANVVAHATDVAGVLTAAAEVFARAPNDVPFALVYMADEPRGELRVSQCVGLNEAERVAVDAACRPELEANRAATIELGEDTLRLALPGRPWPEPSTSAFIAPFGDREGAHTRGCVVFGRSPRLPFDAAYRDHLVELAESIGHALARIESDQERERAEAERGRLLTQEKRARREADAARADLHSLFMQAPAAICVLRGPEHRFDLANPLYVRLVGRDVLGRTVAEAFPEVVEQGFVALLDKVYATGEPFFGNGTPITFEAPPAPPVHLVLNFVYEPFRDADENVAGILVIAFDVTDIVEARAQAEESERQLRELVDNLPELAWNAKPDGHIDFYNRRWYEYTGTTFEQMEGWGWQAVHDPERLPGIIDRWKESLATGQPFETEFTLRGADGVFRWFLTRAAPVRDAEGRIVRWLGTNANIDDRIRNDAFKEVFLGILGHDLRNPLNSILTTARLLTMRGELAPANHKQLTRVVTSGVRMQRMIEQLLDMTRARLAGGIPVTRSAEAVDLSAVVSKVVDETRAANPAREIALDAEGDCFACVDEDRIEQVVSNLLGNAVTHGASDKPVRIGLSDRGASVALIVHNYGAPIEPAFIPLLFNPFARSTTTGRSDGLGLGLYISERIVAAHGGRVEVDSSAGAGTRFEVLIPKGGAP